jgi:FKBP-type peptidyl-prolyl cis-trans isomerase FkpA
MQVIYKATGFIALMMIMLLFIQCDRDGHGNKLKNPGQYKEPLIKANQEAVREENEQIDDFIRRHKWEMEITSTGLRYMITKHGLGPNSVPGKTVKLSYTVTLLTGDTVYTAENDGPLIFEIGKGQVITGLEEAILLLRVGDRAKFIIPSHLAYGLIGDQKKILHKASLVYDIEFISMF